QIARAMTDLPDDDGTGLSPCVRMTRPAGQEFRPAAACRRSQRKSQCNPTHVSMGRADMTTGQGGHGPGATPMHEKRFPVSFIVDDQPTTIEVNSTGDDLTPEQARAHIEAHPAVNAGGRISDIRITPILHPDSEPGHNYQP